MADRSRTVHKQCLSSFLSASGSHSILTRDRVAHYCVGLLICAAILQVLSFIRDKRIGGDFAVFYAEGQIALKYSRSQLYDTDLQDKEYAAVVGAPISSPFAYAPWFTMALEPLARLPYLIAFLTWTSLSLLSMLGAYKLLARATHVPHDWNLVGFLACVAFPPYLFYSLLNGQPTAFGLLILSASFVLQQRGHKLLGGTVLSLLTYKPTLLAFLVPMLLFVREWRMLGGLIIGGSTLAAVSLFWAGIAGCVGFFKLLHLYSQVLSSPIEVFQTEKYVDIGSALRLVFGPQPLVRIIGLLFALPLLSFSWYKLGNVNLSWSMAVVAGLLFSMYSPIYDCTSLIFAMLLFGITRVSTWLLCALYFVAAITVPLTSVTRIQVYTILLIVFLCLLLRTGIQRTRGLRKCQHSGSEVPPQRVHAA